MLSNYGAHNTNVFRHPWELRIMALSPGFRAAPNPAGFQSPPSQALSGWGARFFTSPSPSFLVASWSSAGVHPEQWVSCGFRPRVPHPRVQVTPWQARLREHPRPASQVHYFMFQTIFPPFPKLLLPKRQGFLC